MGMSSLSPPQQQQRFLQGVTLILGTLLAGVLAALSGSRDSSAQIDTGSYGARLVFQTGLTSEEGWSKLLREILYDVQTRVFPQIRTLLSGPGTKVPKETGFLRESVDVRFSEDAETVIIEWSPEYARFLWEDYAPGYVSKAGLARHGEETYPNWSEWAIATVAPILAEGIVSIARAHGMDAEVTSY